MAKEVKANKLCQGVPYAVDGTDVVITTEEGDVRIPLELGKSAYQVVYSHLHRKTGRAARSSNGVHTLGNFSYKVEDSVMTVSRKDGSVLKEVTLDEKSAKYPRNAAIKAVLETLE